MKEIDESLTLQDLEKIKVEYLGKNGKITKMYQDLKNISDHDKKQKGHEINILRDEFESAYHQKKLILEEKELLEKLTKESIDISLEPKRTKKGTLHPLTLAKESIEGYFRSQGFSIETGPEIEDQFHNFDALNIPAHHPARQSHDTFFINEKLLRTHTSTVQIHSMSKTKPPFRFISIGRVYRSDDFDSTHTPMFHQAEGVVVDEKVNISHLKGLLEDLFKKTFEDDSIQVRFRPSFFPFTEPSFEVDVLLQNRWIEILGCGMIHPNVLKNVGIDSEKYQGFAFGMGIERFTMIKYNITDLRLFYNNDLRFLEAFK